MKATLAEVMGTLEELGTATRHCDIQRYRTALDVARAQHLTDEQIKDAHWWNSRNGSTSVPFDWLGQPTSPTTKDQP